MIASPIAAAIGHAAIAVGDNLDDGKANGSFKCHPFAFIGAMAITVLVAVNLVSCGPLMPMVTTIQPDGTKTTKPDHEETSYWGDLAKGLLHDLLVRPPAPLKEPVPVTPATVSTVPRWPPVRSASSTASRGGTSYRAGAPSISTQPVGECAPKSANAIVDATAMSPGRRGANPPPMPAHTTRS